MHKSRILRLMNSKSYASKHGYSRSLQARFRYKNKSSAERAKRRK